jgi:hypothetical protein
MTPLHKTEMPSQDFIKGKADIFSFVMDVLDGVRKNMQPVTCAEIMGRIERYAATPLRASASADYHAGVADAITHFRGYFGKLQADLELSLTSRNAGSFISREDVIDTDAIKYVYNAVEERWEELFRQLDSLGPIMTLGEM